MARTPTDPGASGTSFLGAAMQFLGIPYVYGGAGPTGFDCSGLVQYAAQQVGISAPRTSEAQYAWASPIGYQDLAPGDLVFSQWPGDDAPPGHVAIYAGGGQILEAPHTGESVHVVPLDASYQRYVIGYRRMPGLSAGTMGAPAGTGTGATQAGLLGGAASGALPSWLAPLLGTVAGQDPSLALPGVLGALGTPVANTFKDFDQALTNAMHGVLWIVNPMNWVRIVAGILGGAAVITGAVLIYQAA